MRYKIQIFLLIFFAFCEKTRSKTNKDCEYTLTEPRGIISTPNFPGPFKVPFRCTWKISNVGYPGTVIVIYLTQLYVLNGLKFKDTGWGGTEKDILEGLNKTFDYTGLKFVQSNNAEMKIEFSMDHLENNMLRAIGELSNVYGFNLTYEIVPSNELKHHSCSVTNCSLNGHCYASADLTNFWCSCFKGFSGPNCGMGPLCEKGHSKCQNGATCSHLGPRAYKCICPPGLTGRNCGEDEMSKKDTIPPQCLFDGRPENICLCSKNEKISSDLLRYEGTLKIINGKKPTNAEIEEKLTKYLKATKVSKIENFRIVNKGLDGDVTFHFHGLKKDANITREVLNRLVKFGTKDSLNFDLSLKYFKVDPSLRYNSIKINHKDNKIAEGEEFIISCSAQGSRDLKFNWFKDGVYINEKKATRTISNYITNNTGVRNQKIANLIVTKATPLDEGMYTCQIIDSGIQQCAKIRLDVITRPEVTVEPRTLTVQKGENVSIICLLTDYYENQIGYNWLKNGTLLKNNRILEAYEDLKPTGSLLKIYNIQNSSTYTCNVATKKPANVNIVIDVRDRSAVPLCKNETYMGIYWEETGPGSSSIKNCPDGFIGDITRLCEKISNMESVWEPPNLSKCFSEVLHHIYVNFRRLTYGFQNTTGVDTLGACNEYLSNQRQVLPGEGQNILNMIFEVINYTNDYEGLDENVLKRATQYLYSISDILLQQENSINNIDHVINLQNVIRHQSIYSGKLSRTINSGLMHSSFATMVIDVTSTPENGSNNLNMYIPSEGNSYPYWFNEDIRVKFETRSNDSYSISMIAYKTLTNFLPKISIVNISTTDELKYKILSNIISINLGKNGSLTPPSKHDIFVMDLEISHLQNNNSVSRFINITCGIRDDVAIMGKDKLWDLTSCQTFNINLTMTRCVCRKPGTIAVLLTNLPNKRIQMENEIYQLIVILGCSSCLFVTCITLSVLLIYWYYYRSVLVYLKVQCCLAVIGAMSLFIYGVSNKIPTYYSSYVATALATFLLVGMSSHLSIVLVVYTELVHITRIHRLKPTVVGIITGVPVITLFGNHLAHRSMEREINSWWLLTGTLVFDIFISVTVLKVFLFLFLYFNVMKKLRVLVGKHGKNSKALNKRIGLLWRSAILFFAMLFMEAASICYKNIDGPIWNYIFFFTTTFLGFLLILFYVVKSEISLKNHILRKVKMDKNEEFSSDSANSPLSFFTKQDPDCESESAPPKVLRKMTHIDPQEGLLLTDSTIKMRYPPSEGAPSTIETYLHSISEESLEHFEIDGSRITESTNVGLELYNSSPKKFRKSPIDAALYSESENMYPEHWYVRGLPTGAMHPPDILKTRVCVELGYIPVDNGHSNEANIIVEAPHILLCNVEVDPPKLVTENPILTPKKLSPLKKIEAPEIPSETSTSSGISTSERSQPEGREIFTDVVLEETSPDNLDKMLDRISNDLDYLLDRNAVPEIQITPPSASGTLKRLRKSSVPGTIKEEDETDLVVDIGKTAC